MQSPESRLVSAVYHQSKQEVIELLKTTDVNIHKRGFRPLTDFYADEDILKLLLDAGLDINARNR
jgi:hypothetical protein